MSMMTINYKDCFIHTNSDTSTVEVLFDGELPILCKSVRSAKCKITKWIKTRTLFKIGGSRVYATSFLGAIKNHHGSEWAIKAHTNLVRCFNTSIRRDYVIFDDMIQRHLVISVTKIEGEY